MTESPPRTPLELRRLAPPTTPLQQYSSDDGNDENELNFANTPRNDNPNKLDQSISCQSDIVFGNDYPSIEHAHSVDSVDDGASEISVTRLKGWLDEFGKQNHAHYVKNNPRAAVDSSSLQRTQSIDSDCETDLSVTRLKGWLDDFGKQNRAHYDKVNHVGKVPDGVSLKKTARARSANTPTPKPIVAKPAIRRNTDPSVMSVEVKKGPAKTPVRYKSRFRKDEVQATNDGYASVKKIAAWLADDPTADKKTTTVRKGINVINKSRLFEKDLENVIIEENRIVKGSVTHKKDFFQSEAFTEEGGKCETASCVSVSDKKRWLEGAFGGTKPTPQDELEDGNSIVSMSVLHKREWFANAFKNADGGRDKSVTPSRFGGAASAPGGPTMTPQRNEAAVMSAKQKFQHRSTSRRTLSETSDSSETKSAHKDEEATTAKHNWQQHAARRSISGLVNPPSCLKNPVKPSPSVSTEADVATLDDPCDPQSIERVNSVSSFESPSRSHVARKWQERKLTKQRDSPCRPVPTASPTRSEIAKKWQERKAAKERASPQRSVASIEYKTNAPSDAVGCASPVKSSTDIAKHCQERRATQRKTTAVEGLSSSADAKALLAARSTQAESKSGEEETFDFRSAREKLLKRSAQNGNPVKVINKVTLRKQKFEKLQAEMRRQSAPMGLLKPTWEQTAPEVGPTSSYTKSFVDNVAPKKSFEELP